MALTASEVRAFNSGRVWAAPEGTAFPTAFDGTPGIGWVDLGYTDEDGPQLEFGREVTEVMAWQSYDPVRLINTRIPKTVRVGLLQTNDDVLELAMGGGTLSTPVALDTDNFKFELPDEEDVDVRALIVDGYDGTIIHRWCFPRMQNQGGVSFAYKRTDATKYTLEFKALAGTRPYLLHNDTNIGGA